MRLAIFGPSGAGKSTIAHIVSSKKPQILWVEASRDLIEKRSFPEDKPFLKRRTDAQDYYLRQASFSGPSWASDRLLKISNGRPYVVSTGIRGLPNAKALKAAGFFLLYFDAPEEERTRRLLNRESASEEDVRTYLRKEHEIFDFDEVRNLSDFCLDTSSHDVDFCERTVVNILLTISRAREMIDPNGLCEACATSRRNTSSFDAGASICRTCQRYKYARTDTIRERGLEEILSDIRGPSGAKGLVGFSGGKDSTITLRQLLSQSNNIETFSVSTGYYPVTMLRRAQTAAGRLGVTHTEVDARCHMSGSVLESYERTAQMFDDLASNPGSHDLIEKYLDSRRHYSAKDDHVCAFPRVCVLCRKSVIRAYYEAAIARNAKYIFVGINEWATLSASEAKGGGVHSGIRELKPYQDQPSVFVVHLPYLLGRTLSDNEIELDRLGWNRPFGESLVETNANSCLLAKASEHAFALEAGFHPDSTRLSREVTVGFLSRGDALSALKYVHVVPWSVREVLEYAGILSR